MLWVDAPRHLHRRSGCRKGKDLLSPAIGHQIYDWAFSKYKSNRLLLQVYFFEDLIRDAERNVGDDSYMDKFEV